MTWAWIILTLIFLAALTSKQYAIGIVVLGIMFVTIAVREHFERKKMFARKRAENAAAQGMTLEQYNKWIEERS